MTNAQKNKTVDRREMPAYRVREAAH